MWRAPALLVLAVVAVLLILVLTSGGPSAPVAPKRGDVSEEPFDAPDAAPDPTTDAVEEEYVPTPTEEEIRRLLTLPPDKLTADQMIVVMKAENSRRLLWEVAILNDRLLDEIAPDYRPVLLRIRRQRTRWTALIDAIEVSDAAARRTALAGIEGSVGAPLVERLEIAGLLRPIPAELGPILAGKLRTADVAVAMGIEKWLARSRADHAPIAEPVLVALLQRLPDATGEEPGLVIAAIGSLGIGDVRVTRALMPFVREKGSEQIVALQALARIGRNASEVAPAIIGLFDAAPALARREMVRTLGALGNPVAVDLFSAIARNHVGTDRGCLNLVPRALVACDPTLESTPALSLMIALIDHADPGLRRQALKSFALLRRVPGPLAEEFLAASTFRDNPTAGGVRDALTHLAYRSEADPSPFREVLLAIAGQEGKDLQTVRLKSYAFRALLRADPADREFRKMLFGGLVSENADTSSTAYLLLQQIKPTDADRERVKKLLGHRDRQVVTRSASLLRTWR
jgi:hypothetical protein